MSNFTQFHAGPWSRLSEYEFAHRGKMRPGKVFLSEKLGANGAEISLNRLEPGQGYPFLHKHKRHEEIYLVISGKGEFQVDGEIVPVQEGSVLRIAPEGVRSLRAAADEPLCFACIQAVAGTLSERTVSDGEIVPGRVKWE
jgi:mannose-6-phosphate isomerase-like protein (cupin superfamily)